MTISPRLGVEIEFTSTLSQRDCANALTRATGLDVVAEDYNHRVRDYWKLTTDSSCGLELVSPPLEWGQRVQVRTMMLALQREGAASVDANCGFHVHHEWPWQGKLDSRERDRRLVAARTLYRAMEPLLRVLLPASRWDGNRYCVFGDLRVQDGSASCSTHRATGCGYCAICKKHADCEHGDWQRNQYNVSESSPPDLHGNRYVAVNFVALGRQSTVEYRQHQGTLNPTKALAWVELTRSMVHATSRPDVDDPFEFIFEKVSYRTDSYLRQRCADAGVDFDELLPVMAESYKVAA